MARIIHTHSGIDRVREAPYTPQKQRSLDSVWRFTRSGTPIDEATGYRVVAEARRLVNTPFHHAGRVGGLRGGVDCVGVGILAARAVGLEVDDFPGYSPSPDGRTLKEMIARSLVEVDSPRPGDVLVMRLVWDVPQHVAVYAG